MKARITIRQSTLHDTVYTLINGDESKIIHNNDVKVHGSLMGYVEYLRSIGCNWSANTILNCVRVS